jgi:hypothetical protein
VESTSHQRRAESLCEALDLPKMKDVPKEMGGSGVGITE